MAQEEEIIKLKFDTNAKQAAGDVNKLSASIETSTTSTNENNQAVEQGNSSYKTFKTQLREANQELQKQIQLTGESSTETIKAAKAVAELKDQMAYAKDLTNTFNPDQKMKALGAATQVAGTGLQGVTAGMALFGDQSKDTQAQLLKVQAAMAFSDSISQLSNIGDQFSILKTTVSAAWTSLTTAKTIDTVATEANTVAEVENVGAVIAETTAKSGSTIATTAATIATNLWNASLAVALAPITLIIAGVAGLVLGIGYLTGAFGDFSGEQLKAEVANKKLSNSIDAQEKAFKKNNEQLELSNTRTLGLAKAQGQSTAQIQLLENALINQEVAQKRVNAVNLRAIAIEAIKKGSAEGATDAEKETAKKAIEAFKKSNENYESSLLERKKLAVTHQIEIQQDQTDANKKAEEKQKDANEKAAQKIKEANKAKADLAKKDAEEKAKLEVEKGRAAEAQYDELLKIQADAKKKNEDSLKTDQQNAIDKENKDFEEKKARLIEANLSIEELENTHLNNLNDINLTAQQKAYEVDKDLKEKKIAAKKAEQDSLNALGNAGISAAKDLFSKNKIVQKGVIVAESAVALGKLATGVVEQVGKDNTASPLTFGMPWSGIHIATGALGAASIISNTNKQLQALGGGSAPSAGSAISTIKAAAPPTVAFNNTAENQIGQSVAKIQTDQPPLKVYVSESDISDAQNNVKVLVKKNVF